MDQSINQPQNLKTAPKLVPEDDNLLKSLLIKGQFLSNEELQMAEGYIATHHISLFDYLLNQNIVAYDLMGQTLARYYGVEFADLGVFQPTKEYISMISPEVGQKYRVVVYKSDTNILTVATDNPRQTGLLEELKRIFGDSRPIEIAYAMPDDLNEVLIHYRKPLVTRFNQILKEQNRVAPEIINEILKDATAFKVSDIHFEPQESIVLIRFRIDGVLHDAGQLPKQYYDNILNRLKVQAHMRIDEHNMSQDGAIRYKIDGKPVNVRMSVIPTLDGEKAALRILAEYSKGISVKSLGLSKADKTILDKQIHRPYGMIITTGPTGSGKTTTLYSMIKMLNNPEINVTTIEDPVEYKIVGVNQIQVNQQTHINFTEGLRAMLRQDPDVILVGEIRDNDTAELAVNAALTGHLLFSTFHANTAAAAIPRLLDMDVEPFLLASTLNLVIAQRLVRTIHPACRYSFGVDIGVIREYLPNADTYFHTPKVTLYQGKGCNGCNFTGYHGRTAIFELISINPEMKELILKNPSTVEIERLAKKQGDHTLFEDGIEKIQTGLTTLQELLRVAEPR
ncbi:MAG TPA: ATPase, T2SS/T4P/T4SS family [Candidatus Saccharimonadales bacterium]|nr:ATPase, T2SS/T4P/T4SS family [Candidatus Saccharimonadales bacterium]